MYKVKAIYHTTPNEFLENISAWNTTTHSNLFKNNLSIHYLDLRETGTCDEILKGFILNIIVIIEIICINDNILDCDYVIHTATAQNEKENEKIMKNILLACQQSPSLKKYI